MNILIENTLPDETLSSWAWRNFNESTYFSEKITLHNSFYSNTKRDPDFDFSSPFAYAIRRLTGVSVTDLSKLFSCGCSLVMPRLARCAYCYKCMEDSIKKVGLPSWHKSWCCPFTPLCQKHGLMLIDGDTGAAEEYDAPGLIFINHVNNQFSRRSNKLKIRFSQQWHGPAYMQAAFDALKYYKNIPVDCLRRRPTLKRLWEYVFVALTICQCARFGGRVDNAIKIGAKMPEGRKDRGLVVGMLECAIHAASSVRTEALFYCGMVFGVFRMGTFRTEAFAYAPMDPLFLGQLIRREKPKVADWLVTRLLPCADFLHPATEQFFIGLNIEPASYATRFSL